MHAIHPDLSDVLRRVFLVAGTLILLTACSVSKGSQADKQQPPAPADMQWWTDAKFGMFIHWGPYALFEGEWNGRQLPVGENAEWIMQKMEIPVEEYRKRAATFNPVKFNAEEWVELANHAGMKYLVITAKHHDGFAMYDSEASDYNIVDYTPFDRDPMKELSAACADKDIRFCFYYSHREDWDHPYAYGNYWDYKTSQQDGFNYDPNKPFTTYLEEKAKPQLRELLTNYGPIGLLWFDRGMYTREQGLEFVRLARELQPQCLINGRVGNYNLELIGDYQNLSDNGMPPGGVEEYWETPQTLNETWGYSKFDTLWKSHEEVIHRMVEIVSKGGNYLLNIGPKGDGAIPQASIDILRRVGDWMQVNSESIYGTTASPFQPQPWGFVTVKGQTLYLHVLDWPADGKLRLEGLQNPVRTVSLLTDRSALSFDQQEDLTVIDLPAKAPDAVNTVLVAAVEGALRVSPPVLEADEKGAYELTYSTAVTSGRAAKRFNRKGGFYIGDMLSPADSISWYLRVDQPGNYRVEVLYSAIPGTAGAPYTVAAGEGTLNAVTEDTGEVFSFKKIAAGTLRFDQAGVFPVRIYPSKKWTGEGMYVRGVTLLREE